VDYVVELFYFWSSFTKLNCLYISPIFGEGNIFGLKFWKARTLQPPKKN
jgi:hypothetical protein